MIFMRNFSAFCTSESESFCDGSIDQSDIIFAAYPVKFLEGLMDKAARV
jgi:hypothetical protein